MIRVGLKNDRQYKNSFLSSSHISVRFVSRSIDIQAGVDEVKVLIYSC